MWNCVKIYCWYSKLLGHLCSPCAGIGKHICNMLGILKSTYKRCIIVQKVIFCALFFLFGEVYEKSNAFPFCIVASINKKRMLSLNAMHKNTNTIAKKSRITNILLYIAFLASTSALGESDSELNRRIPTNDWKHKPPAHKPWSMLFSKPHHCPLIYAFFCLLFKHFGILKQRSL